MNNFGSFFRVVQKAFKLIKAGVVDFISSDIHFNRENYLKQAYDIVNKKFGSEICLKLFKHNAEFLININEE